MKAATYFHSALPVHLASIVSKTQETAATQPDPQTQTRQYVWPVITIEDHKKTLDNYRAYIQAANEAILELNTQINKHNRKVAAHIKKNPVTDSKAVLIKLFTSKYNHLSDRDYNDAVDSFNSVHGLYFNKRTLKQVKPFTIQVFESFLHAYTVRLQNFVSVWKKSNKTTPTPLPKLEIHPYEIINQQRGEGVLNLDISTRTIYRHRDRLEEVGVLVNREYRGTKKPVNYFIADSILSISEAYSPKTQNTDNQPTKGVNLTECQHIKVSTRPNRNKKEIKGIVNNSDNRNAPSSLYSNLFFYKTTNMQGEEKKQTSGAEKNKQAAKNFNPNPIQDKQAHLWMDLVEKLDSRYDLAAKLANGEFNYYTPLDIKKLNFLSSSPMPDDEFRDVGLQDFIKSAAALNRHNQAGAGSWYIAIGDIDRDFGCFNFQGRAMSKQATLQKLIEFRYRLRWALNWFNKREWTNTPYANLYFDTSRTLPSDISWQYTKKIWSKKMQKITKAAALKKKKAAEAAKRKAALSTDRKARQKLDNAIYRYLRNELNFTQLTAYVVRELPQKQQNQLGDRLNELTLRRLTKDK